MGLPGDDSSWDPPSGNQAGPSVEEVGVFRSSPNHNFGCRKGGFALRKPGVCC